MALEDDDEVGECVRCDNLECLHDDGITVAIFYVHVITHCQSLVSQNLQINPHKLLTKCNISSSV